MSAEQRSSSKSGSHSMGVFGSKRNAADAKRPQRAKRGTRAKRVMLEAKRRGS